MKQNDSIVEMMKSFFADKKCWKINELALAMQYSVISTRRFLKKVGYYSSFTHNGQWYTLADIPAFNKDGIWFYNNIGFSRHASLTNTLVSLVGRSKAGISCREIEKQVQCRCGNILKELCKQKRLIRQQEGRNYLYFSVDKEVLNKRRVSLNQSTPLKMPAEIAVLVLAEFIRTPKISPQNVCKVLKKSKNFNLTPYQVERLLSEHSLKKTVYFYRHQQ